MPQNRRRQINHLRLELAGWTVHKKYPRNARRVDEMVSAPAASIVFEHMIGETAERTLPGYPESGTKVH